MDAARASIVARNGTRIRAHAMVEEEDVAMGGLGTRAPGRCPYGLGAGCPLVEVAQGAVRRKERLWVVEQIAMAATGIGFAAAAVWLVYF